MDVVDPSAVLSKLTSTVKGGEQSQTGTFTVAPSIWGREGEYYVVLFNFFVKKTEYQIARSLSSK